MPTIPALSVSSLNNYAQNTVVATLTCNTPGLPSRFRQAVPQSTSTATTA